MFEVYKFEKFSVDVFYGEFETVEEAIEECHDIRGAVYVIDVENNEVVWREFPVGHPLLQTEVKVEEPKKKTLVERLLDIIK